MSMTKVINKISIVGEKIFAKNYLQYAYVIYLVTHVFGYISLGKLTSNIIIIITTVQMIFFIFLGDYNHTYRWSFVFRKTERYWDPKSLSCKEFWMKRTEYWKEWLEIVYCHRRPNSYSNTKLSPIVQFYIGYVSSQSIYILHIFLTPSNCLQLY